MIVMREVFKRDKPLDNGSGAVSLCVFHSNVNPGECGALTVTPTKDYCRRCAFYKTREDFDRGLGKRFYRCGVYFAHYIKENEPALSANSTSSTKKENTFQIDDSTKEQICQAYKTADEACSNILTVYEGMSECEQRAFDIGEAYGKIFDTRCKLEELRGGDGNEH